MEKEIPTCISPSLNIFAQEIGEEGTETDKKDKALAGDQTLQ